MPVCVSNPSTLAHGVSFILSGTYELHGSRRCSVPLCEIRSAPTLRRPVVTRALLLLLSNRAPLQIDQSRVVFVVCHVQSSRAGMRAHVPRHVTLRHSEVVPVSSYLLFPHSPSHVPPPPILRPSLSSLISHTIT